MKRGRRLLIAEAVWNAAFLALNFTFALLWGHWWSWAAAALMAAALVMSVIKIRKRKAATAVPSMYPDPTSQYLSEMMRKALMNAGPGVSIGSHFAVGGNVPAPKTPTAPSEFKGVPFDLALGEVYGLRMWKVDPLGRLRARNWATAPPWRPGINVAKCVAPRNDPYWGPPDHRVKGPHDVPHESCTCGFYAYTLDQHAETQNYKDSNVVLGIVKGTGRTLIGTQGFRCEKAEIIALRDPTRGGTKTDPWRVQQLAQLQRVYPDIPLFPSRAALLEFAPLTDTLPDPSTDEFWDMP